MPSARVIADSVSPGDIRLTTMEVVIQRYMLAELNTHRSLAGRDADSNQLVMADFSRNSASSRAIPFAKMLKRVMEDPAIPVAFKREQKGMQAGELITGDALRDSTDTWLMARDLMVEMAGQLADLGVHKSIVNRLIEPFVWHTAVVTSSDWVGFFAQRCSDQAQDDIRVAAESMRTALALSEPQQLHHGEWHLPYINDDDRRDVAQTMTPAVTQMQVLKQVSSARTARTSYLTQSGVRDMGEDLDLFGRLRYPAGPVHWSPLEHVARPQLGGFDSHRLRNFRGWVQFRTEEEEKAA